LEDTQTLHGVNDHATSLFHSSTLPHTVLSGCLSVCQSVSLSVCVSVIKSVCMSVAGYFSWFVEICFFVVFKLNYKTGKYDVLIYTSGRER